MKTVFAIALALVLAPPLNAQGWIEPIPDRPLDHAVKKVRTDVSVRVVGRVAHVSVEEWFRNDGAMLAEGDYLYPLPGEAVFSNFSLFQGDKELRGETMDAAQARSIYEEIVRRKRDPALIELAGHGLIRARIFPINQGETRKIALRYTQILSRAGDALQFRYVGGRRNYGVRQVGVEAAPRVRPERQGAPLSFTLTVENGQAFRDPFSPTHQVRVSRDEDRITVRPEGELEGDFTLFLPLARGLVGLTIATHRPTGENGYFMLTLSPGDPDGNTLPRDVTVVLDVSGSMSGSKLDQAKAALRQLLASLNGSDRFQLVTFSNSVQAYRATWSEVTAPEIQNARRWVDGLTADGGTNIAGALAEAFRLTTPESRVPIVLFMTDGLPTVGESNPERIASQAENDRDRARIFAFGIGYDVNTYLLDRLSAAGRGATEYVEPGEDVESALSTLAQKIRHPVLVDLEIAESPARILEVYPVRLPDLFVGEELVIFGRYQAPGTGSLVITGTRNGQTEQYSVSASFPDHELGNDFIPRLWASRKIGELARAIQLNGHNPELEKEIRDTALRYGLLSEYTSYLVQEPDVMAQRSTARDAARRGNFAPQASVAGAASGAAAVQRSRKSQMRREVRSQAELAAADELVLGDAITDGSRHVAGRLFRLGDGVWTDVAHSDTARVVEIDPYSQAYFDVLRRLPELEPYFGAFEKVVVAGQKVSIRVVEGGVERMSDYSLRRLVREFRSH